MLEVNDRLTELALMLGANPNTIEPTDNTTIFNWCGETYRVLTESEANAAAAEKVRHSLHLRCPEILCAFMGIPQTIAPMVEAYTNAEKAEANYKIQEQMVNARNWDAFVRATMSEQGRDVLLCGEFFEDMMESTDFIAYRIA